MAGGRSTLRRTGPGCDPFSNGAWAAAADGVPSAMVYGVIPEA
jgi:hypothetical protein